MRGRVLLVGAGPGDPDLLTVRAAREIGRAEVLLYDALVDPAVLELAPPGCERIDVGKRGDGTRGVSQDEIAALMLRLASGGRRVVRLKGGDPFVFGRGGEEAGVLRAAGVPFEIVPGISSALAVPAFAGIPVTDRRWSSSFAVVTGHRGKAERDDRIDWEGLAASAETLVVLMGTAWLPDIARRVIEGGRDPDTPAAAIESGATPEQRVVRAPLGELADRAREAGLRAPTVIVIGAVAQLADVLDWYERRPLFGRRVLVGRAAGQRAGLVLELRGRGARPVCVPLLEFAPPADPAALAAALADPDAWDWIAFTSSNAVHAAVAAAGCAPARARVACIGAATARAAGEAGWRVDVCPPDRALPEALVGAMESRADLSRARVLVPRAQRARQTLVEALAARGADVTAVEAYRTRAPAGAAGRLAAAVDAGLDAVALTSPSSVEHLFGLLDPARADALRERAWFACIGPTTRAALEPLGVHLVEAEQASDEGLADALEQAFESAGPVESA